jgi:hypothetical protein
MNTIQGRIHEVGQGVGGRRVSDIKECGNVEMEAIQEKWHTLYTQIHASRWQLSVVTRNAYCSKREKKELMVVRWQGSIHGEPLETNNGGQITENATANGGLLVRYCGRQMSAGVPNQT